MTYRDELEATRARVAALEDELEEVASAKEAEADDAQRLGQRRDKLARRVRRLERELEEAHETAKSLERGLEEAREAARREAERADTASLEARRSKRVARAREQLAADMRRQRDGLLRRVALLERALRPRGKANEPSPGEKKSRERAVLMMAAAGIILFASALAWRGCAIPWP